MKRPIYFALGVSALMALLSLTALAAAGPDFVLGRYPKSVSKSSSVHLGGQSLFSQDSVYETSDALADVLAWYVGRYRFEPEQGWVAQGQCVRLGKVNGYFVIRQTIVVAMCPSSSGTQVFFNQVVYLGP